MIQKKRAYCLSDIFLMYALYAGVPSEMAQENISLGEDLAGSIISNFPDGGDDEEKGDNANAEIAQDSTNTAAVNPNQEQTVDEDNFAEFGDDTADHDAANVVVPIAVPINVDEEEEEEVPPECPAGFTLNTDTD